MTQTEPETRIKTLATASQKIKEEANAQATALTTTIDPTSSNLLKSALRNRRVEEIDELVKEIDQKIWDETNDIQTFPHLYASKEVWIKFIRTMTITGAKLIDYEVIKMQSDIAPAIPTQSEQQDHYVRLLKPSNFTEQIENLKQGILNGVYDEKLTENTRELIYNTMKQVRKTTRRKPPVRR